MNICDWLTGGKSNSYLLDWMIERTIDMNHPCPYHGNKYVSIVDMAMGSDFTEDDLVPIGNAKLYLSISNHHLEVVSTLYTLKDIQR